MPSDVGQIGLDLKISGKDYKKQIKQYGDYGSKQLQGSFSSTFKSIGKMAVAAFATKAIADFTASCLKLGSNLTEVQNVVDVAFPQMNAQINEFAKNAMTQFGMSETVAKKYAGTFGAMSKAFGFTEQASADMAMELTGLVGDVASFYNMNTDEAYTKLKSVFTGETETLKELGVVMTQNALDQYALANSYGKTTAKMSEQEKVALRMKFVTEQLSLASGDFVRTQDSWANQTRVLSLRFDQLKASLGKGFIALFTPIVKGINWVLACLQPLADSFASLMEMLTGTKPSAGGGALANTAGDIAGATEGADGLSDGLMDAGKSGEKAAKKISKAFAKVDTINKLTFNTDSEDSGSGDSGGGSAGGGSIANAVEFPKATEQANVFKSMMDGIVNEFKRLGDLFKTGFTLGFGNSFENINSIKDNLSSIKDSIINIFTSPEVINAAKNWVASVVLNLGKAVGSIASIGTTIGALITGSVAQYLENNTGFIKSTVVSWFDLSSNINDVIGNFSAVVADIFSVFASMPFIQIGSNIIQAIANGAMNSITLLLSVAESILKSITEPIISNKDIIKSSIEEMFKPLVDITGKIADSLTNWDRFMKIVGLVAGTFIGLKTAMGFIANFGAITGVIGALGGAFSTVGTYLSVFILGLKEGTGLIGTMQAILPSSLTSLSGLSNVLLGLINPVTLFATAIAGLVTGFVYLYTTSETFRQQINAIFVNILENITGVVTGIIEIVGTIWTIGIEPFITSTMEAFQNLWDNGLSVFVTNVSVFVARLIDMIMSIWNNAVNPFINLLLNTLLPIFTTVWNGLLAVATPIIEKIMEYVNKLIEVFNEVMAVLNEHVFPIFKTVFNGLNEVVKKFWEVAGPIFNSFMGLLGNVVSFALDFFLKPLDVVFDTVVRVIKDIMGPISQVFDGLKQIFQGVIDFITGVFSGNWERAWSGIVGVFKGIVNTIGGIFKIPINAIIGGINSFLGGLNKIKIPDWVPGVGGFGFNIGKIPMLAQGGYVKANQPQLAMIGDNKRYGEIVAPENKMIDMIDTALKMQKENGSISGMDTLIMLIKQLIDLVKNLSLKVDIDMKKMSVLLDNAKRERQMMGG